MNDFFTKYPEILNHLHDAVISTNLEGIVTDCNAAAETIYEFPREELIGSSVAMLYPEDQLARMQELVAAVHANGRAGGEFLNRTKRGRAIWIHLSVSLLRSDEGPTGMIGFSIDITEQRKAAQARREIEEMKRAARAAAGVGTWFWNLSTGEMAWDEESNFVLGLPADTKPGYEAFFSRVHPEDRAKLDEAVQRCIENGGEYSAEFRYLQHDGSIRWLNGRGRVFRDEKNSAVRLLGVGTDITARKTAEAELEKSQAKYRALFDSPSIGVATANVDRLTDVNETYCKLIGYSREELLSGAVRWQDITPNEYLERDFACMQEMLATGVGSPFEKDYIRKDGTRIRVLLGATLLSREPLEWSCFILDITQQHRTLAALRAGEELASAAKMGSALAHEINNPLASLTNVIYLLRFGNKTMQREELLVSAQEALERVTRITRQMIGLWSDSDNVSEFKIGDILEDTMAAYSARTRAKNLRIKKRNELSDRSFRGVESDFRRLLSSLVENAVDHTQPGGVLQVHISPSREWRESQRSGVKIVVLDNGPGISPQTIPHLFEPFYSTKNKKGSGLGLWASRGIAEKHQGSLRVRTSTRPGASGTCVAVFLPERSVQQAVDMFRSSL